MSFPGQANSWQAGSQSDAGQDNLELRSVYQADSHGDATISPLEQAHRWQAAWETDVLNPKVC